MDSRIKPQRLGSARAGMLAAGVLLTVASAGTAMAASVTVSSTCTFVKAVGSINAGANQSPCTHTGTYGSNDTIVVPVGSFDVTSGVTINRSVTIHGGGKWDTTLQCTNPSASYGIQTGNPSIVVKIDNLQLSGAAGNTATTGIIVRGANDTNLNDNNLELSYVILSGFNAGGLLNGGGRTLIQNTLIYLNSSTFGGGVANTTGLNSNGTTMVGSFVAKYSAISLNTATVEGGGIYNTSRMDLRSTLLQQNQSAGQGGAIYVSTFINNPLCNITRDVATADPSEIDDNVASQAYGIVASSIACNFHDTIGSGNSSPYCSPNTINCPQ